MRQKKDNDFRGFSLLEVMVATVIFATTALGLVALNKVSMSASVYGRERTAAVNLAQYGMTWIQNEVAAYASAEPSAMAVPNFFSRLKETAAPVAPITSWVPLSGTGTSLRFDEYMSNVTDSKYPDAISSTAKYCIHYRVLLANGPGSTRQLPGNLYHASVLVTWPREGQFVTGDSDWKDCASHLDASAPGGVAEFAHSVLLQQILTRDFSNKVVKED